MNIVRINHPDLSSMPPFYIQDIPKFVDNFRLTDWLELGNKGFIKRQVISKFKRRNKASSQKYMKFATLRNSQGFIFHSAFLAQEMIRINNTPDIANVSGVMLFDLDNYDSDKEDNLHYGALFMQYTDIDEDLVPDEWADCKENIQFPVRDYL